MNSMNILNNYNYSIEYLKNLIRTIYFKKEFLGDYNKYQNNIGQEFIIKKDIIFDLKQKFKLNEIIIKIENHPKLNGITYNNFDNNFPLILEAINERDRNYLNSIKKYDNPGAINFTSAQVLLIKKNINEQNGLKYVDNFEIIDTQFAVFLQKYFYQKFQLPLANFCISDNYILLMINHENDFIYEIASLSQNCVLTIECLIQFISHKFNDINQFNTHIFQFFIKNGIQKLILSGNPIRTENDNAIFNIYPTNNNFRKNIKLLHNLKIGMNLVKEKESLLKDIKKSKNKRKALNKECYLIHKNYFNEYHLNTIKEIINWNYWNQVDDENKMLNILKQKIPENIKKELDNDKIHNNLNDKNTNNGKLFYPNDYKNDDVYYFKNCNI